MSDQLLGRLYGVARAKAAAGEAWDAICATVYADVIAIAHSMEGDEDAALDGRALAATPIPQDGSRTAESLVLRMREILIGSIPEKFRGYAQAMLEPADYLAGFNAPATTAEAAQSLARLTGNLRPHAYKNRTATDARVHARAAAKMAEAGVDEVDIVSARRASDFAAFEAASMEFAFDHGDWSLDGHRVRLAAAKHAADGIAPEDTKGLREALIAQFEGVVFGWKVEWPVG